MYHVPRIPPFRLASEDAMDFHPYGPPEYHSPAAARAAKVAVPQQVSQQPPVPSSQCFADAFRRRGSSGAHRFDHVFRIHGYRTDLRTTIRTRRHAGAQTTGRATIDPKP